MDFQLFKAQENPSNTPKGVSLKLSEKTIENSITSFESNNMSGSKQTDFRSSIDLDIEADHSQWNGTKNNISNISNIKVASAYFGADQPYSGYFEEFTTQNPIDFDIELKESSEAKFEDHSSSSSSMSKSSKKISKIQKEELAKHTPLKAEKAKGKKNPWQPSEDAKVIELISHYGQSWAIIAAALGNRTGKQVRDRYLNYLRADIKDQDFSVSEDRLLLSLYYQLGHKWSKIASHMPGRTECQVKNRFYAHIKKRLAFPDFPENKNLEDMFFEETNFMQTKNESNIIFEENKENSFQGKKEEPVLRVNHQGSLLPLGINDPTDVISYESKSRSLTQSVPSGLTYQFRSVSINENYQTNAPIKITERNEIPSGFLNSFHNINTFCDNALFKTEDTKIEHPSENNHKQAMFALESELSREKSQRYDELLRRKKALEFFYAKTLKEMNDLEINEHSTTKMPN